MPDVNDELTRKLLDEGAAMLTAFGSAGLSLRKLAAAVGTSTMAVYTRFGGKDELLSAMYREGFRRLGERMGAAARSGAGLAGLGRAYRDAALASPHLYALMFGPPPHGLQLDEADRQASRATFELLVQGVRGAVTAGVLVGEPRVIALHLWSVAHGLVSLEISGRLPVAAEDPRDTYDTGLGLAARPFVRTAAAPSLTPDAAPGSAGGSPAAPG